MVESFVRGGRVPKAAKRAVPNRSVNSIIKFLMRVGLWEQSRKPVWMLPQERALVEMWNGRANIHDIARAVGNRTVSAVYGYVDTHRQRLKLIARQGQPMKPGQVQVIGREVERAIDRAMAATGRPRGSVVRHAVRYLLSESKRVGQQRILDLGGMAAASQPGTKKGKQLPCTPKSKRAA